MFMAQSRSAYDFKFQNKGNINKLKQQPDDSPQFRQGIEENSQEDEEDNEEEMNEVLACDDDEDGYSSECEGSREDAEDAEEEEKEIAEVQSSEEEEKEDREEMGGQERDEIFD